MMPHHHPTEDLLIAYAAGSLAEPVSLVVATHLAFCADCRFDVSHLEAVGGLLLEEVGPEPVAPATLEALLARLDEPAPAPAVAPSVAGDSSLPQPLRSYVAGQLDRLAWKNRGGVGQVELLTERADFRTRLLRIPAGMAMPQHSHEGSEYTLVLAGGFSDQSGHFLRGDVATADPTVDHRPIADAGEDCLCLAVTDAPLRLTGRFTRMLNPFLRV